MNLSDKFLIAHYNIQATISHAFVMSPLYDLYVSLGLRRARHNIKHWLRRSNYVRTELPLSYCDKVELMEAAVFQLVIDYIAKDQEDAHSHVVIADDAMATIIDILHFVHIRKPALEKRIEALDKRRCDSSEMIWSASGQIEWYYRHSKTEFKALLELGQKLEAELYEETQKMLKKCIDVRNHLWS